MDTKYRFEEIPSDSGQMVRPEKPKIEELTEGGLKTFAKRLQTVVRNRVEERFNALEAKALQDLAVASAKRDEVLKNAEEEEKKGQDGSTKRKVATDYMADKIKEISRMLEASVNDLIKID